MNDKIENELDSWPKKKYSFMYNQIQVTSFNYCVGDKEEKSKVSFFPFQLPGSELYHQWVVYYMTPYITIYYGSNFCLEKS